MSLNGNIANIISKNHPMSKGKIPLNHSKDLTKIRTIALKTSLIAGAQTYKHKIHLPIIDQDVYFKILIHAIQ